MDGTDSQTRDLIAEARAELEELEERINTLRDLLDRVAEAEGQDDAATPERRPEERFTRKPDGQASVARSVASHMALDGYPRENAEERLRGTVSRRELSRILDEVYGSRSAAVRST